MIFLVRHAKAGNRNNDLPDDHVRPLTDAGWRQAHHLVKTLADAGAAGPLVASPFTRCMQTLEPMAQHLGTVVTSDSRLAESQPFLAVLNLIGDLPEGAVLCSHGDTIPAVIQALERRGCAITTQPQWKKASVWVLLRDHDGQIVSAAAWAPPKD